MPRDCTISSKPRVHTRLYDVQEPSYHHLCLQPLLTPRQARRSWFFFSSFVLMNCRQFHNLIQFKLHQLIFILFKVTLPPKKRNEVFEMRDCWNDNANFLMFGPMLMQSCHRNSKFGAGNLICRNILCRLKYFSEFCGGLQNTWKHRHKTLPGTLNVWIFYA